MDARGSVDVSSDGCALMGVAGLLTQAQLYLPQAEFLRSALCLVSYQNGSVCGKRKARVVTIAAQPHYADMERTYWARRHLA